MGNNKYIETIVRLTAASMSTAPDFVRIRCRGGFFYEVWAIADDAYVQVGGPLLTVSEVSDTLDQAKSIWPDATFDGEWCEHHFFSSTIIA